MLMLLEPILLYSIPRHQVAELASRWGCPLSDLIQAPQEGDEAEQTPVGRLGCTYTLHGPANIPAAKPGSVSLGSPESCPRKQGGAWPGRRVRVLSCFLGATCFALAIPLASAC